MKRQAFRFALFAAYQLSILFGILLLPVTLVTSRLGIVPPIGRVVDRLADEYERLEASGGRG